MDLFGDATGWTKTRNIWSHDHHTTRQHQCIHIQTALALETQINSSNMASSCCRISPIIIIFVVFLLVASTRPVCSLSSESYNEFPTNQTFQPGEELQKLKWIKSHLRKINKPPVKTIQSPDGDLIDCVLSHQQPAFDHPKLKGQKPMDPPERPKGHDPMGSEIESFQLWRISGESCPEGTIPIRRTTEKDVLRASSIRMFGRKRRRPAVRALRRDSTSSGHEHAVGYVMGDQYYGAKASLNVWAPHLNNPNEFSLSHMWVILDPSATTLTPSKRVGRQLDATTSCALVLCKLTRILQSKRRSDLLLQVTTAGNSTSVCWCGRSKWEMKRK